MTQLRSAYQCTHFPLVVLLGCFAEPGVPGVPGESLGSPWRSLEVPGRVPRGPWVSHCYSHIPGAPIVGANTAPFLYRPSHGVSCFRHLKARLMFQILCVVPRYRWRETSGYIFVKYLQIDLKFVQTKTKFWFLRGLSNSELGLIFETEMIWCSMMKRWWTTVKYFCPNLDFRIDSDGRLDSDFRLE